MCVWVFVFIYSPQALLKKILDKYTKNVRKLNVQLDEFSKTLNSICIEKEQEKSWDSVTTTYILLMGRTLWGLLPREVGSFSDFKKANSYLLVDCSAL